MHITVLTGDLVDSTAMSKHDIDAIMDGLKQLATDLSDWPSGSADKTIAGFARRGGDSWQIAYTGATNVLRVALLIQANVSATVEDAQTRIAIATGEGIIEDNLNSAHGAAFTESGQLLDHLDGPRLMAHADGGALDAAFCLADHLAKKWTQAQARALALKLRHGKIANKTIADRLGISRQAVDQALASGAYPTLKNAISALDKTGDRK